MDLENLCVQVKNLAIETGEYILYEQKKISSRQVEAKGVQNYVTYVDTESEKKLTEGLHLLFPEAGFITEEGTILQQESVYKWIIDPLDGTTNFIHGLPPYSISIALANQGNIVLGIIYEITSRECYYAWEGSKAYMNGLEIHVSNTSSVNQSLIATGFPYTNFDRLEPFIESMSFFMKNSHGLRRLGSAAVDMAYVACGRFDAFYEYGLHAWDVAAASLIVRQAGGEISDFNRGDNYIFGEEIITTNHNIFNEFQDIILKLMVKKQRA